MKAGEAPGGMWGGKAGRGGKNRPVGGGQERLESVSCTQGGKGGTGSGFKTVNFGLLQETNGDTSLYPQRQRGTQAPSYVSALSPKLRQGKDIPSHGLICRWRPRACVDLFSVSVHMEGSHTAQAGSAVGEDLRQVCTGGRE